MLQQVAVQRINRRIVNVRREHAFAQVVENHDARRSPETTECLLMQLGPNLHAGAEHQEAHALPAVPERHHEQPRTAILAALRISDHGAGAVIDLPFLTRGCLNHHSRFRRDCDLQLAYVALDTLITGGEALVIDQVRPLS